MSEIKIVWSGSWRRLTGRIGGRKRFEIQGDGEKYEVHHYCGGRNQRIIVSTRARTLAGARGIASRYMRGHSD